MLYGLLASFAFDFAVRQKIGGVNLNFYLVEQFPALELTRLSKSCKWMPTQTTEDWLRGRVLELTYTAWDLESLGEDLGWAGPPFRWDDERRFLNRCELDAAFFHLYLPTEENGDWCLARKIDGCPYDETPEQVEELKRHFLTPRDAVDYIMDSFPIVRRKDEEAYDEYRTKRVILEIYDAIREAIRNGQPYETHLDPAPGPPLDADGNFVTYASIADTPPSHIHLPHDAMLGSDVPLQVSDLATRFPDTPFRLRLDASADTKELYVRPVPTSTLGPADTVVLASPQLQRHGSPVLAAIGRFRVESRTDADDGSVYKLVSVRGDDGLVQARFSEVEWETLQTIGVVEDGAAAEASDG